MSIKNNPKQVKSFYNLKEDDLEWILEALAEGYTKKQLAKQFGVSVYMLNRFLKGEI